MEGAVVSFNATCEKARQMWPGSGGDNRNEEEVDTEQMHQGVVTDIDKGKESLLDANGHSETLLHHLVRQKQGEVQAADDKGKINVGLS